MFSHGVSQYHKDSTYTMSLNVSQEKEWMSQYKKIWNEVESQLFEKLATELIKRKYVRDKLITWKESIKINFHGLDLPYNTYCNAMAVLKINSVYKQSKNHPQTYVKECKCTNAEKQQWNMLNDDDGLRYIKKKKKQKA